MKKLLVMLLPVLLAGCAYEGHSYVPYGVNVTPTPRYYPSNNYYAKPKSKPYYNQPNNYYYNNNQYYYDKDDKHKHHDHGKHKGHYKNKHHDD